MNCRKVNQQLSAYMDGELPGVEHRQVFEHIARCEECRTEYEALLQTKRLLGAMRQKAPRADLEHRLVYHIAWESGSRPGPSWQQLSAQQIAQPFAAAAVLVALSASLLHVAYSKPAQPTGTIVWEQAKPPIKEFTGGLGPTDPRLYQPAVSTVSYSGNDLMGFTRQIGFDVPAPERRQRASHAQSFWILQH